MSKNDKDYPGVSQYASALGQSSIDASWGALIGAGIGAAATYAMTGNSDTADLPNEELNRAVDIVIGSLTGYLAGAVVGGVEGSVRGNRKHTEAMEERADMMARNEVLTQQNQAMSNMLNNVINQGLLKPTAERDLVPN